MATDSKFDVSPDHDAKLKLLRLALSHDVSGIKCGCGRTIGSHTKAEVRECLAEAYGGRKPQ
jgi:hypothetical protein